MVEFDIDFTYSEVNEKSLNKMRGTIKRGECVVLCGHSGCGKSTMIRTINRLIPHFYEGKLNGYCKVLGHDIDQLSIGEVGKIVATVFQDPRSQFFTMNTLTELAFGLENFGVKPHEIINRVDQAFTLFSLERLRDRNVFELSSGERQLIAILCMWVLDTDICVLDEPTANLDYHAIDELTKALKVLKANGKTIIINEHRLYYLASVADVYWLMNKGSIQQIITKDEMNDLSNHELNQLGLRTNRLEALNLNKMNVEVINHHEFIIENINFKYSKNQSLTIKDFSYKSQTGDVVAIIGGNGCGKTTLGKIITGLMKSNTGSMFYDQNKLSLKQLQEKSIFIMQETEFQFFTNSVYKELVYGKVETEKLKLEIDHMLKKLDMIELKNRHPFSLSGGQMQKLSLLIAYFCNKPIVVLDEPTAGLDYRSMQGCIDLIKEMKKTKIIYVITHDLEFICQSSNQVLFIQNNHEHKTLNLTNHKEFEVVKNIMKHQISNNAKEIKKAKLKLIDPRIKVLLLLNSIFAEAIALPSYIITSFIFVVLVALYERKYKTILRWGTLLITIYLLPIIIPSHFTMFLSQLLPRFILLGISISVATTNDGASKLISALRKMKVPEKIIMVASVILRFFPVLTNDFKLMKQAIKTRSILTSSKDKLKNIPFLLEIMIVPLSFRVIKIAEVLAASAQTRGIDLKNKRNSFINVRFEIIDYLMIICFMLLFIVNFVNN